MESAGGLVVDGRRVPQHAGSIADETAADELAREPRLPNPLPGDVERVARASMGLFGILALLSALFVVASGVAVVLFPILLGRDGVGRSMVTLFLFCFATVLTGLALLAARSAARIVRRERRGLNSLIAWLRIGAVASVIVALATWGLSAAFVGDDAGDRFNAQTLAPLSVSVLAFSFFVWGIVVMQRYRRGLR